MSLRLYNTLTRSLEAFQPLSPPAVTMYVCGPTVYDDPHLGHARSAYTFDVLRRHLRAGGFQVRFVRNVTDVDDKIIERARQESAHSPQPTAHSNILDVRTACGQVAERYLTRYHETMDRLGIERPDVEPKATEHVVPQMTDLIAKLLMQGVAYEAGGDVYFAVRKHASYGQLSNRTLDELKTGARVEPGEHKQDPLDFALWKAAKPGEPSWNSPWGPGRPGWHIECSAMSTHYLGEAFDIHGGGVDLIFPHHENEIAQAHAAGKPFARWWVHNGLLTVNGEKMSKSLGNFITVEQALESCGGNADALKGFFLSAQYRSPLDYTARNLASAGGRLAGWEGFLERAQRWRHDAVMPSSPPSEIAALQREFEEAMDHDLNTPMALAALDKLVNVGYQWEARLMRGQTREAEPVRHHASAEGPACQGHIVLAGDALLRLGQRLGLFGRLVAESVPAEVLSRVQAREEARVRRDFATADRLRGEVHTLGYLIEDTARGSIIRRKR